MTIRIYGKTLEKWTALNDKGREVITQYEIAYTEYDAETMEITATGSEDFSPARYAAEINEKYVWVWDGEKHNKGEKRMFGLVALVKYRKREARQVKKYLIKKYSAADLELR